MKPSKIKIGTRGSPLALAQAREVQNRLAATHGLSEDRFEIVPIKTTGDRIQNQSLNKIGGKGLFTKEIEDALLYGRIDIAVHSMKDMPVEQPKGLVLECFLPREDVRDAFVSFKYTSLQDLPIGATVGTSSVRRRAQILHIRPDLNVVEFRGNVQTRLNKLERGIADATFLAMAGLNRLGLTQIAQNPIPTTDILPAVAQGAIGVECSETNEDIRRFLSTISDLLTAQQLSAERSFLKTLDGSCQTPIAGLAILNGENLVLEGQILHPNGTESVCDYIKGPVRTGAVMGEILAKKLLEKSGYSFTT